MTGGSSILGNLQMAEKIIYKRYSAVISSITCWNIYWVRWCSHWTSMPLVGFLSKPRFMTGRYTIKKEPGGKESVWFATLFCSTFWTIQNASQATLMFDILNYIEYVVMVYVPNIKVTNHGIHSRHPNDQPWKGSSVRKLCDFF